MDKKLDYLPLSYLNQIVYCPRRFWLMFVYGEMDINAAVLDGRYRHEHANQPGHEWYADGRLYRSVYVWSDALHVAGLADFVEEKDGNLVPLEHKRGRMGKWQSDHVQLCAQAICLEERTGLPIQQGEIFYWANRRREIVMINEALRLATWQAVEEINRLLEEGKLPDPIRQPGKCRDCSLQPICLPEEVWLLRGMDR
jgi:CRISPR-associated exonuclease Cas4